MFHNIKYGEAVKFQYNCLGKDIRYETIELSFAVRYTSLHTDNTLSTNYVYKAPGRSLVQSLLQLVDFSNKDGFANIQGDTAYNILQS